MQPFFGALYEGEQGFGLPGAEQFAAAFFLFDPAECCFGVGVQGQLALAALQFGQAVHYSQKFSNVVGPQRKGLMKPLLAGGGVHPAVFHYAGIAAAGCIDCETVGDGDGPLG